MENILVKFFPLFILTTFLFGRSGIIKHLANWVPIPGLQGLTPPYIILLHSLTRHHCLNLALHQHFFKVKISNKFDPKCWSNFDWSWWELIRVDWNLKTLHKIHGWVQPKQNLEWQMRRRASRLAVGGSKSKFDLSNCRDPQVERSKFFH